MGLELGASDLARGCHISYVLGLVTGCADRTPSTPRPNSSRHAKNWALKDARNRHLFARACQGKQSKRKKRRRGPPPVMAVSRRIFLRLNRYPVSWFRRFHNPVGRPVRYAF